MRAVMTRNGKLRLKRLAVRFKDLGKGERFAASPNGLVKKASDAGKIAADDIVFKVFGGSQGALRPNKRTYLELSGWSVYDLGTVRGQHAGYAVAAAYHRGTLVTFMRGSNRYPLLVTRWSYLRTDPEVMRYKTRAGAQRALHSFFSGSCASRGMICPVRR